MKMNFHENEYMEVWLENGIVTGVYKSNTIDIVSAKECVSIRLKVSNGKPSPTYLDARKVKSISKEARDYFASDEGRREMTACAIVVESAVGRFLVNFFLQINKPPVPIKFFSDKEDAVKWLQQLMV